VNVAPTARQAWLSRPFVIKLRKVALGVALGLFVVLGTATLVERHRESDETELLVRTESFADLDGDHVRYRLTGMTQPGPMVVFLNGMAASLEQWEDIQPSVAAFAPTLLYDRGGYGYSYGSSPHSAGDQADELAALLAKLQIDRPLVLVGYSVSASIARVFVSRHKAMVVGVTFLEPYLPELQGRFLKRDRRLSYTRWLGRETVSTLLGYERLRVYFMARRGEKVEPLPQLRFSHWWAVDRELYATPETQAATLAADHLDAIPLILLAPKAWDTTESYQEVSKVYRDFVKTSATGSLRYLPDGVDHGEVVEDKRSCDVLIDTIHELVAQAH
jgi:pimeloyl-ACP methyl ester carboxylesterase